MECWKRVIVLANRAPFKHQRSADGHVQLTRSASGLVTALEPLVAKCAGTWIAFSEEQAADDTDLNQAAPRGADFPGQYALRCVNLDENEYTGYYYGFANEGLWPLCHAVPVEPVFRQHDYRMYRAANSRFAAAAADTVTGVPALVLVQDYHFALAPRMLRTLVSANSTIAAFWHIPWPPARVFAKCPCAAELIDGLLGSDVLGFQTDADRDNFLECVAAMVDADIVYADDVVCYRDQATRVRVLPVGVDWNNEIVRALPPVRECRDDVCRTHQLPERVTLGVGVDRLDYTKGIREKFLAIERLLERHLELRPRFAFIQVAEPSRACLPHYREARGHIDEIARRINTRFGTSGHQPIRLLHAHHEPSDVYRLYRAADFCYVGSLHDGMNLVAKEFVSARTDHRGVLVLSQFAGAARQLRAAVLIDPYAVDATANALARAVNMAPSEQAHRMRLLRANVAKFDSTWWGNQLLGQAASIDRSSTGLVSAGFTDAGGTAAGV
jgi:trehalose 6-phosphate synthase